MSTPEHTPPFKLPDQFEQFEKYYYALPSSIDKINFLFTPTTPCSHHIWVKELSEVQTRMIMIAANLHGLELRFQATLENDLPAIKITATIDPNPRLPL